MATRSNIAYQRPNGQVVVAYCHWDGYPEHNGVMLNEHYNNQSKAEELANQGYLSSLKPTIKESLDDRANIQPPTIYHSAHTFYNDVQFGIEWIYLFKNNQWYVCVGQSTFTENDLQPLWSVLAKLEKVRA
tara:strand:+ start:221 stop:613 length:393 start_codon:yes stop_codon:yes gene_type:complete